MNNLVVLWIFRGVSLAIMMSLFDWFQYIWDRAH